MRTALFLLIVALGTAPLAGKQAAKPASTPEKLPPISYVCPMPQDADVIEDKPGKCPKCGMTLEPIRLDSVWTCPVHAAVIKDKAGKCPIDQRDLEQVTMAVSWTCPNTNVTSMNPGTCADGSAMVKKYTPRPHGNHNPQHGGQFFMAPDNWHHLEGTYPRAGVFRMYLYDDFTRPLPRAQARQVSGRVLLSDGSSYPLALAQSGRYLEAKVGKASLPAQMAAKVRFKPDSAENHFDFTFDSYSKEPTAAPTATMAATTAQPAPAPATAPSASAAAPATVPAAPAATPTPGGVDPGLIPLPIPGTVPEMLAQLSQRTEQIKRFIDQGAFANVYVPAFQAKDLALALDEHKKDLPPDRLKIAEPAIKRLVRTAWLLDAFGDIGNKNQITEAYAQFAAAVKDVESAFPGKP